MEPIYLDRASYRQTADPNLFDAIDAQLTAIGAGVGDVVLIAGEFTPAGYVKRSSVSVHKVGEDWQHQLAVAVESGKWAMVRVVERGGKSDGSDKRRRAGGHGYSGGDGFTDL